MITAFNKGRLVTRKTTQSDKVFVILKTAACREHVFEAACMAQLGSASELHPNGSKRSLWGWHHFADLELVQP